MKKIEYKKYRAYKILLTIILAGIVSAFVVRGNFIIPLIVFFLAILLMYFLRKRADFKLSDERIESIAGKSSRIVMVVSALLMSAAGIVLIALRETYPQLLLIGNILIYTECGMMLLYAILFKYYSKKL